MWGYACVVRRQLGRVEAVGPRSAWVMLTVVAQVLGLEVAAAGDFRQRSAVCRIRGVGDHRWREGVPRW
jgi:hypothetical protein